MTVINRRFPSGIDLWHSLHCYRNGCKEFKVSKPNVQPVGPLFVMMDALRTLGTSFGAQLDLDKLCVALSG